MTTGAQRPRRLSSPIRWKLAAAATLLSALGVLDGPPALAQTQAVAVSDAGFGTHVIRLPEGGTAQWNFGTSNRQYHKVSAFFFTSPAEPPGSTFSQQFASAGNYAIGDSPSGDTMHVNVQVGASPASGTCSTSFAVVGARWAPGPLFLHTYQVLIPGGSWRTVLNDTLDMYFLYTPGGHCAPGTYSFRAQTVLYDNHSMHSGWSAPVAVSVTA